MDKRLNDSLSIASHLRHLLSEAGRPLDKLTLVTHSPGWTSIQVSAALNKKPLFRRVAKDLYGLSEWDLPAYSGVSDGIEALLKGRDAVHLSEILEHFEGTGLAEGTIRAYSSTWPFQVESGWCSRRTSTDVPPPTSRQRRYFFILDDEHACLRLQINYDHLRGSGFLGPRVLADWLGMQLGEERHIMLAGRAYRIVHGRQFRLGSLGPVLRQLAVCEGETVILRFAQTNQQSTAALIPEPAVSHDSSGHTELLLAIGRYERIGPPTDVELLQHIVAEAMDTPSAELHALVAEARARRDERLVSALVSILPCER